MSRVRVLQSALKFFIEIIPFYRDYTVAKKTSAENEVNSEKAESNRKKEKDSGKTSDKNTIEDLKKYFRESFAELKKVQWPTRRQAMGETVVVLITVVFLTSLVVLFDKILEWGFGFILK